MDTERPPQLSFSTYWGGGVLLSGVFVVKLCCPALCGFHGREMVYNGYLTP